MLKYDRLRRLPIVTLLSLVFAAAALTGPIQASPEASSLIGRSAPAFTLPNVATGEKMSLDSLRQGKSAVILIFVSTRCPVSNSYDDRMNTMARTYATKNMAVVGINSNVNEPVKEVVEHARKVGFVFPVLKDGNSATADAYGARHTPEVYVVDAKGIVVYHGRIDDSMDPANIRSRDLATALDQIASGEQVTVSETKAFGCSIKRPRVEQ